MIENIIQIIISFFIGFFLCYKLLSRTPYIYVDRNKNQVKIQYLKRLPIYSHPELEDEDKTLISNLCSDDFEFYESLISHKNKIIEKKFSEFVKDIKHMGGI